MAAAPRSCVSASQLCGHNSRAQRPRIGEVVSGGNLRLHLPRLDRTIPTHRPPDRERMVGR